MDVPWSLSPGSSRIGTRLTSKLGKYSLGALIADDRAPGLLVPENDPVTGKRAYFGIARLGRDIMQDSSACLIYTGREFNGSFNRVAGADTTLRFTRQR